MSRLGDFGARLYHGEASFDFVGRRRTWYLASLVILLVAVLGLVFRGLQLGVEFKGGAVLEARSANASIPKLVKWSYATRNSSRASRRRRSRRNHSP